LVLGASRRSALSMQLTGPGIGARTVRHSGDIDVHIVTHEHVGAGREPHRRTDRADLCKIILGAVLATLLLTLLTLLLTAFREDFSLVSCVLLYLVVTVAVALVGGLLVALLTAVAASLLLNYFFTEPTHTFTIADRDNPLGLLVFVLVAATVAVLVDRAERRRREAARASAEAEVLATIAGSVLRGSGRMPALVGELAKIFRLDAVSLLEKDGTGWRVAASAGSPAPASPDGGRHRRGRGRRRRWSLRGPAPEGSTGGC
jgi:two-component system sensor histidine kinase KdpD